MNPALWLYTFQVVIGASTEFLAVAVTLANGMVVRSTSPCSRAAAGGGARFRRVDKGFRGR